MLRQYNVPRCKRRHKYEIHFQSRQTFDLGVAAGSMADKQNFSGKVQRGENHDCVLLCPGSRSAKIVPLKYEIAALNMDEMVGPDKNRGEKYGKEYNRRTKVREKQTAAGCDEPNGSVWAVILTCLRWMNRPYCGIYHMAVLLRGNDYWRMYLSTSAGARNTLASESGGA